MFLALFNQKKITSRVQALLVTNMLLASIDILQKSVKIDDVPPYFDMAIF